MVKYKFDEELNILIVTITGICTISDIKSHYIEIIENKKYPSILRILVDATQTKLDVNPDDLKQIFFPLARAVKSFKSLHEAILVDKPLETAMATLFEIEFAETEDYKCNIFSTKKAAVDWLLDN